MSSQIKENGKKEDVGKQILDENVESYQADSKFENMVEMQNLIKVMDSIDRYVEMNGYQHDRMGLILAYIRDHPEQVFPRDVEDSVKMIEDVRNPELEVKIAQVMTKIAQLKTKITQINKKNAKLKAETAKIMAKTTQLRTNNNKEKKP